jgi:hypothetical protein
MRTYSVRRPSTTVFIPPSSSNPAARTCGWKSRDMIVDISTSLAKRGPKRIYILNTGVSTLRPPSVPPSSSARPSDCAISSTCVPSASGSSVSGRASYCDVSSRANRSKSQTAGAAWRCSLRRPKATRLIECAPWARSSPPLQRSTTCPNRSPLRGERSDHQRYCVVCAKTSAEPWLPTSILPPSSNLRCANQSRSRFVAISGEDNH